MSLFTVFELLDGLHRGPGADAAARFASEVLPAYEILDPDLRIVALAAEIHARLAISRGMIGLVDTSIAATAIERELVLVTSNTKHFERVAELGYPLRLANWRGE